MSAGTKAGSFWVQAAREFALCLWIWTVPASGAFPQGSSRTMVDTAQGQRVLAGLSAAGRPSTQRMGTPEPRHPAVSMAGANAASLRNDAHLGPSPHSGPHISKPHQKPTCRGLRARTPSWPALFPCPGISRSPSASLWVGIPPPTPGSLGPWAVLQEEPDTPVVFLGPREGQLSKEGPRGRTELPGLLPLADP